MPVSNISFGWTIHFHGSWWLKKRRPVSASISLLRSSNMEAINSLCFSNPQCCRVASAFDAVQNSECVYTFHSPFTTDQGILVSLESFVGTVDPMAMLFGSNKALFVRIVKRRVEKELIADDPGEPAAATPVPTKLALGVEGGFATEDTKYETISTYSVVALENESNGSVQILAELPYSDDTKESFPVAVQKSVDSVIQHAGVSTQQQVNEQWAGEEIPVSKYYENLPFVDNGVVIDPDPKTWKCEKTGATENLWLNLSDGFIGGGRKHWDVRRNRRLLVLACMLPDWFNIKRNLTLLATR